MPKPTQEIVIFQAGDNWSRLGTFKSEAEAITAIESVMKASPTVSCVDFEIWQGVRRRISFSLQPAKAEEITAEPVLSVA